MSGVAYPSAPEGPRSGDGHRSAAEDDLFLGLVVSNPQRVRRLFGLPASLAAHGAILLSAVLLPIYWPEPMPDTDPLRVLLYNPPAAMAAPLPKGSALAPKTERPKPTTPEEKPRKPTLEMPVTPTEPQPLQPEAKTPENEQAGSPTGSDMGIPEGMEGGQDGGVVGGTLNGVLGGCAGCDGNGPVLDYDQAPRLLKQTKPQYPQEAFIKKIEGTVVLEILIDANGHVPQSRVIHSIPALDDAARQCVAQWAFTPALKHGHPVATIAQAPVMFRIY